MKNFVFFKLINQIKKKTKTNKTKQNKNKNKKKPNKQTNKIKKQTNKQTNKKQSYRFGKFRILNFLINKQRFSNEETRFIKSMPF